MTRSDLLRRVQDYAARKGLVLREPLGSGVHGIVWAATSQLQAESLAVKVLEQERDYRRERDVYLRLQEHEVTLLRGCQVPELLAYDDDSFILVMTLVARPFVLDFAGAYLDHPPDFPEEVWEEWRADKAEQFGPRWPEVLAILGELEGYGVYMEDVNPGNIAFGD